MDVDAGLIFDQLIAGLGRGSLLFLIASGLTLVLGVLHVLNFAHGVTFLFGAYMSFEITNRLATTPEYFWLALILAPIATAAMSGLIEVFFLRPIYKRHILYQFLILFGVGYILSDVFKMLWGVQYQSVSRPEILSGSVHVFNRVIPNYTIFMIGIAALAAISIWFILNRTWFGRTVRAVHEQSEMASALGVNIRRLYTTVFMVGSFFAGLGGVVVSGLGSFGPGMDAEMLILAFIVVCVGGMGSISGAIVGALIIGIAEAYAILYIPKFALVILYFIMALVLYFRPWGLLGRAPE